MSVSWLHADTAKATRRLTVVLIWIFAVTVAYPYIPGSESEAFKGISVFVGLMVSLGSAGLVNQVMSGLVVAYTRALKAGEFVHVGNTLGTVSEVGMRSTKVITPKRETVTVPNVVFNEYGVQIMSPNFRMQPENKVWVPKDQWYAAPADSGGRIAAGDA
jgi:small-conductance mechanosensitive channel